MTTFDDGLGDAVLGLFRVDPDLVRELRSLVVDSESEVLPFALRIRLDNVLSGLLRGHWIVEDRAIALKSWPLGGVRTGRTTNGLHLDDGDGRAMQVNINTGDIPRFVYFVQERFEPSTSDSIRATLYADVAMSDRVVHSVEVFPGESWILPTELVLHDGRRAVQDGFSSVVMMSARCHDDERRW